MGPQTSRLAALCLAVSALGGSVARAQAQAPSNGPVVGVCDGAPEWPPFTYFRRVDGRPSTELTGFSVDVVSAIFERAKRPFRVELLPWRRCLTEVAQGSTYQVALEASSNPEREATYWLSRPFYRTTGHYFYSRQRFPSGPEIAKAADLNRYRICGLLGFNYAMFGLDNQRVEQANGDHAALIRRLQSGRCDLFVEQIEVMVGYRILGQDLLADPDLGHQAVPGLPSTPFHMLVSRKIPQAQELLHLINTGLADLEARHELDRLWSKHTR